MKQVQHQKNQQSHSPLLVVGATLLGIALLATGCQFDPWAGYYTQTEPKKADLIGTYVLTSQTLNDIPVEQLRATNGSKASVHKLILRGDGTFTLINMPIWAGGWANGVDESAVDSFRSGSGRWDIEVVGVGDAEKYWGLILTSSTLKLPVDGVNLAGEKPPYDIVFGYGDPDTGDKIFYSREPAK